MPVYLAFVRGLAIMFRLLPPTHLALGHHSPVRFPDASSLFNLMRNLGWAIGLALIDTVIYLRAPVHGLDLMARCRPGTPSQPRWWAFHRRYLQHFRWGHWILPSKVCLHHCWNRPH